MIDTTMLYIIIVVTSLSNTTIKAYISYIHRNRHMIQFIWIEYQAWRKLLNNEIGFTFFVNLLLHDIIFCLLKINQIPYCIPHLHQANNKVSKDDTFSIKTILGGVSFKNTNWLVQSTLLFLWKRWCANYHSLFQ